MAVAALVVAVLAVGVATWSAWSAHRSAAFSRSSAVEARRARLDEHAASISIVGPEARRERWVQSTFLGQEDSVIAPDREFVVPRNGAERLLIGAELLLINEGSSTSYVRVSGRGEFVEGVGAFPQRFLPGENSNVPHARTDGAYAIPPLAKCLFIIRDGYSLSEWIAEPSAPVTVEMRCTGSLGSEVEDVWTVELKGSVVDQVAGDDSHWRVVPHTPIRAEMAGPLRRYKEP